MSKLDRLPDRTRLTLALDADTYRRLRLHAVDVGMTHQAILEDALKRRLKSKEHHLPELEPQQIEVDMGGAKAVVWALAAIVCLILAGFIWGLSFGGWL